MNECKTTATTTVTNPAMTTTTLCGHGRLCPATSSAVPAAAASRVSRGRRVRGETTMGLLGGRLVWSTLETMGSDGTPRTKQHGYGERPTASSDDAENVGGVGEAATTALQRRRRTDLSCSLAEGEPVRECSRSFRLAWIMQSTQQGCVKHGVAMIGFVHKGSSLL